MTASVGAPGGKRLVVSLETSARPASIAALGSTGAVEARTLLEDRRHASDLLGELGELVRRAGGSPADLDLVVAGVGPGSYTGLRVGAATALGLMRGAGATVMGVPSFDGIAMDGLEDVERGAVLRNAFGGHLYVGVYERRGEDVVALLSPACLSPKDALEAVEGIPVVMADAASMGAIGAEVSAGRSMRPDASPRAETLLQLALHRLERGARTGPDTLKPLYLRPFDAKVRRR